MGFYADFLKKNNLGDQQGSSIEKLRSITSPVQTQAISIADVAKKKGQSKDPEKKAIDFYLTELEQKKVLEKESSTTEDILDAIDNVNRLFYGVTAGTKAGIKAYQAGKEFPEATKEVGKAVLRGLKREERVFTRDIYRLLDKEDLENIEKDTFKVFGMDALEMDKASLPFFAADVLLDPVTYIPFGLPLKLTKQGLVVASQGLKNVAKTVAGAEKVDKLISKAGEFYVDKVAKYFNLKSIFKDIGKEDLFETLKNAKDIANAKAYRLGTKFSRIDDESSILGKRWMKEEEANLIGETFHKANDEAIKSYESAYAKRLGVNVEDFAKITDIDQLTDEITELSTKGILSAEDKATLDQARSALGKTLQETKGRTAKLISQKILEKKKFKKLSDNLSKAEAEATKDYAKARFNIARDLYKEGDNYIKKELDRIHQIVKIGDKSASQALGSEIDSIMDLVKLTDNQFKSLFDGKASGIGKNVGNALDSLKDRISKLSQYQIQTTKGLQQLTKSDVPLQKINGLIRGLEADVGRETLGVIGQRGEKLQKQILKSFREINSSLDEFKKLRTGELTKFKGDAKLIDTFRQQLVKDYQSRLKTIVRDKGDLDKFYRSEVLAKELVNRRADKFAQKMGKQYYNTFSKISKGRLGQKVIQDMHAEREIIFNKALQELPEELRPSAKLLRDTLDDYAEKMQKGDNPLLKGISPLYMPRVIQKEFIDEISDVVPMFRGGQFKSFVKKRKFKYYDEYKKYVEGLGGKIENDAAVILTEYIKKADMSYAKHLVQEELEQAFKKIPEPKVRKRVKEAVFQIYSDTATRFNNPVWNAVSNTYGKALNAIKTGLTIINPSFQGRNILGFPFLAATTAGVKHGLNPLNYVDAFKIKYGGGAGEIAGYTIDKIRKAADESGYFASSFTRGDIKKSAKQLFGRYSLHDPRRWMAEIFKASADVEDIGRYGALVANLKSGMNMEQALKASKEAMFDYNLINSPADKALQGIFGFYTFSRRNLPQQIKTLLQDPKHFATLSKALDRISNREEVSQEDLDLLNNFDKESFKIFGEAIDGIREFKTLGFFPTEEAYQTLSSIRRGDVRKLLGSRINPALGDFMDWFYGKDSFIGKDFGNSLPATYTKIIPEPLQKAFGLTKRKVPKYRGGEIVGSEDVLYGDPDKIFAIRNIPIGSRFINELSILVDNIEQGKPGKGITAFTTGVKTKELDVEKLKQQKEFRKKEMLRKAAKAKGAKEFKSIYVPKIQKGKTTLDEAKERLEQIRGK